uniref:Peptidase M14 carboxypeptidase A domain-containing protein n=1 Tax=Parascaris equorum TaxID=6256 RepID=A0A914R8S5_PAREQ
LIAFVRYRLIIDREKKRDYGYGKRLKDDPNVAKYDFYTYGSYPQMVSWMRALARQYPNIVQFISIGKSHEGRSIDGLEVQVENSKTIKIFLRITVVAFLARYFHRNIFDRDNSSVVETALICLINEDLRASNESLHCLNRSVEVIIELSESSGSTAVFMRYGRDTTITNYVDNLTWVIVPCLNPDGYEFTHSSTNPNTN